MKLAEQKHDPGVHWHHLHARRALLGMPEEHYVHPRILEEHANKAADREAQTLRAVLTPAT